MSRMTWRERMARRLQLKLSWLIRDGWKTVSGQSSKMPPIAKGDFPPPKISQTVEEWRRGRSACIFTKVSGPHHVHIPENAFLYPHPSLKEGQWRPGVYTVSDQFAIELPYGRTVGRYGAVITQDNVLLDDLSLMFFHEPGKHPLLGEAALPPIRRLEGRYALLNGPSNTSYHWLYDNIARLAVLLEAGYTIDDFDGFLMTKPKYEAYYDSLDFLGIPREKVIWCTKARHFECRSLVASSFTNNSREHHPLVFPFLRRMLPPSPRFGKPRLRLLVSREDAVKGSRRIANEDELMLLLKRFGFQKVVLGNMSFLEQMRIFASAEFIISPHGGGLSNLCFCEPPAKLLELFGPRCVPTYFRSLAHQLNIEYEAYVGVNTAIDSRAPIAADIWVDPTHIEAILCKMLK